MGQPAARLTDQTAHGGMIAMGYPTVLIGMMPAARVGDPHICAMVTGVVPHVGGPILPPGSTSVFIGGAPAAKVGDMLTCAGGPDTIAMGCMTVLIGDNAGGGGAGGGGEANAGASASASATTAATNIGSAAASGADSTENATGHYLDISFVDKGGYPIVGPHYTITAPDSSSSYGMLTGVIKDENAQPGTYSVQLRAIVSAKWSKNSAKVKEKLKMTAETEGILDGAKAHFEVYIRDNDAASRLLTKVESKVQGGKFEADWELVVDDQYLAIQEERLRQGGFSFPTYYFVAILGNLNMRSALLECRDDLEIKLKEADGTVIGDRKYKIVLPSGEVREGTLDGSGDAKLTDVPPGLVKVAFDLRTGSWKK